MVRNIARLRNCDRETRRNIKQFDVIGLTETWIDKENVEIKRQLEDRFAWKMRMAKKEKRKGRASGGSEIRWLNEEVEKVVIKNGSQLLEIFMVYMGKEKQRSRDAVDADKIREDKIHLYFHKKYYTCLGFVNTYL